MLIKLSNDYLINPDKITCIYKKDSYHVLPTYVVVFDAENRLVLNQEHFDELLSCLPSPVEAEKDDYDEEVENDVGHGTYIVEIGGSHG